MFVYAFEKCVYCLALEGLDVSGALLVKQSPYSLPSTSLSKHVRALLSLLHTTFTIRLQHTFLRRLVASQDFKGMEEGMDHDSMYHLRGLKMLYEGDGYVQQ